jgi:hypothetical protein
MTTGRVSDRCWTEYQDLGHRTLTHISSRLAKRDGGLHGLGLGVEIQDCQESIFQVSKIGREWDEEVRKRKRFR